MNIVITEWNAPNGLEQLKQAGHHVHYDPGLWNRPELSEAVKAADALIVRNQTRVDAALIEAAPRLKVIGRLGAGLDNIDLDAAARRDIPVVTAGSANASSVAEYVIAAIFHSARRLGEAADSVRSGGWLRQQFTLHEIEGKTLGLIGVGEIGRRTGDRAKALGMNVLGFDPRFEQDGDAAAETGIIHAAFNRVLAESDYVSLHLPLLPSTRGLIGASALNQMKASAVLINTSRGGVVDEDALAATLSANKLAGAVLDVLSQEPPRKDHPLLALPTCTITPHIAGLTQESQEQISEIVSAGVINALGGQAG
ncbi:hydroxyacid dehydrogenase [Paenibacillus sp. 7124]|uniref:Hydroxyacid dehydrogenase n=1 Tax=Paenibacillus apii TaxID=1850370 RepID=A0A6M1PN64_9BACL|nr:hydroxyacid dehydrogenase [Paenibacillus apii]NGM83712.1 hydroxyacid dehydrogenase [Paenibacillus apii]NJJ41183.1 hydroxyacid dehydrogenase [Paenibacillus apii]